MIIGIGTVNATEEEETATVVMTEEITETTEETSEMRGEIREKTRETGIETSGTTGRNVSSEVTKKKANTPLGDGAVLRYKDANGAGVPKAATATLQMTAGPRDRIKLGMRFLIF